MEIVCILLLIEAFICVSGFTISYQQIQVKRMAKTIRNVFISHHHKDDSSVDGLTKLVSKKDHVFRNSSIRVKPENEARIKAKQLSDRTIARLLRMKMRWASQVIVVIGKETHSRDWVNWEIKTAHQLGIPIIGVFEDGLKGQVDIPENLEKYASAVVGWRADSVVGALDGESSFQKPDGTAWPKNEGGRLIC